MIEIVSISVLSVLVVILGFTTFNLLRKNEKQEDILAEYLNYLDRLSKTIAMTAITDFLFYGFASNSNIAQTILSKSMETLNKSKLKNIFSKLAAK